MTDKSTHTIFCKYACVERLIDDKTDSTVRDLIIFSERLLSPILPIGAVTARAVMCSVSAAARPVLMASMRAAGGYYIVD